MGGKKETYRDFGSFTGPFNYINHCPVLVQSWLVLLLCMALCICLSHCCTVH